MDRPNPDVLLARVTPKRPSNSVVVGPVETHKRADTEALFDGLEVLPCRRPDAALPARQSHLGNLADTRPCVGVREFQRGAMTTSLLLDGFAVSVDAAFEAR